MQPEGKKAWGIVWDFEFQFIFLFLFFWFL